MSALYTLDDVALLQHCSIRRGKAQGPGGQHRHAHASGITITCNDYDAHASCGNDRSAQNNQKRALRLLRIRLALQIRGAADPRCIKNYTQNSKLKINPANKDFPHIIAYLLDVLETHNYILANTSEQLGISSSQILKTLAIEKEVWQHFQAQRTAHGLAPLKAPKN